MMITISIDDDDVILTCAQKLAVYSPQPDARPKDNKLYGRHIMSQPPASGDLNSDLVTLTFDLLTVELGCNVSRGADNLPFPPILVFTRLCFVELWAN